MSKAWGLVHLTALVISGVSSGGQDTLLWGQHRGQVACGLRASVVSDPGTLLDLGQGRKRALGLGAA